MLLFIVDGTTRGVASMIETAEYLARERKVVLVRRRLKTRKTKGNPRECSLTVVASINR